MDIAIIFGLILLNGVFAMSEIALVSSRKIRLQQAADDGSESAKVALQLASEPSRFLSTVQIGITLIGILAGAYGEASIARRIEAALLDVALLEPYAQPLSLTLMVILITYFSLIFGELVPKRLALLNPEGIAKLISRPLHYLSLAARPLVILLGKSTELVLRLLRAKPAEDAPMFEEEIHSLMKQGTAAGVLEESEHVMVRNVLRLDDLRVGNIMRLKQEIITIDVEDSLEVNCRRINASGHSRFPVVKGALEEVIGIVRAQDVIENLMQGQPIDWYALAKPVLKVRPTTTALQLLESLKQSQNHLALVANDLGNVFGLVTLRDVMEAIVGDLPEAFADPDFIARDDGTWLVDGQVDLLSFKEHFEIKTLPGENESTYHTLAGFILSTLGRLPRVTDRLDFEEIRMEVVDMDCNRVDKVLVTRQLSPNVDDDADNTAPHQD